MIEINNRTRWNVPRLNRIPINTYHLNRLVSIQYQERNELFKTPRMIFNIRVIIKEVLGYDPYENTESRDRNRVMARQFFLYFVRKYVKNKNGVQYSEVETAELLGQDHCSVIHAIKCVNNFCGIEKTYKANFDKVNKRILGIDCRL
jgi:chromosomal replication initiation ATPase DnaA